MSKAGKTILIILSIAVVLVFGAFLFVGALWNGTFNFCFQRKLRPTKVPTENIHFFLSKWVTPHGHLVQQMCD